MHITPAPPSMTIARVRELTNEMAKAPSPVVCSFTRDQLIDLLVDIDMRTPSAPAPPPPVVEVSPVNAYADHRKACERCRRGGSDRCENGQRLYALACASLMDQTRLVL